MDFRGSSKATINRRSPKKHLPYLAHSPPRRGRPIILRSAPEIGTMAAESTLPMRASPTEPNMHPIHERYPMMRPYVGGKYLPKDPRSLMLVGESHYLPDYSTQHQSAESWYRGDASTLNREERGWIDTARIIEESIAEKFRNRAHSIYRRSFFEINQNGPAYSDYLRVGDIVVFCNYFLRPARTGASLCVDKEDKQIAEEVFRLIVDEFRPGAVVFLSRLAFRSWQAITPGPISLPVIATPHPGCAHWNRVSASYGGKRGREVLGEFVRRIWHPGEPVGWGS